MTYYFKKNKGYTALTLLLIVITSVSQMILPLFEINIFQYLLDKELKNSIIWSLYMLAGWIFTIIMMYLKERMQAKTVSKINTMIRSDISDSLTKMQYSEFYNADTGKYVSWFTNDINQINQNSLATFFNIFESIVLTVSAIIVLFFIHYVLVIASVILVVVLLLVPMIITKKAQKRGAEFSQGQETFTADIQSILNGYSVFRAFNLFQKFKDKIFNASSEIEDKRKKYAIFSAKTSSLVNLVNIMTQVALMIVEAFLVVGGLILPGAIISTGNIFGNLCNAACHMATLLSVIKMDLPIYQKINELKEKSKEYEKNRPNKQLDELSDIKIKELDVSYDDKKVLSNINMEFKKGNKYAIVGPSGCGKTTLLKTIIGFNNNYNGEIYFDDKNLKEISEEAIFNKIAYIDQNVYMFNTSIKNNITMGQSFSEEDIQSAIRKSALENEIKNFADGLDTIVGENGNKLSGGQRQRIALARAFIYNKKVILMDEGTSALDKLNAHEIEKEIIDNKNITAIIISHNISEDIKKDFNMIYDLSK